MRARILPIAVAGLLAAGGARGEEFRCPGGARDSGATPGQALRWCGLERDGRLVFHGPVWRWHRNGQLMSKEHFVQGELEGEVPSWWENGQPSSLGTYRRGERVGVWKFWDEEGRLAYELAHRPEGVIRDDFHASGGRRSSGEIRAGAKYGRWSLFHEDGREKARCDFGDGVFVLRPEDDGCRIIAEEVEPRGFGRPIATGVVADDGTPMLVVGPQAYAFTLPDGWEASPRMGADEGLPLVFLPLGTALKDQGRRMSVRAVLKEGRTLQTVVYEGRKQLADRVGVYEEFLLPPRTTRLGRVEAATVSYTRMTRPNAPFAVVEGQQLLEGIAVVDASPEVVLVVKLQCDWRVPMKEWLASFLALVESARRAEPPPATAPRRPPS